MNEIEPHPWKPFLPQHGRVLMLGSFPPQPRRWCMDFYYPNFNNDFWRIIGLLFYNDTDRFILHRKKQFDQEAIIRFLHEKGIGIYDTAVAVRRLQDNASDKYLEVVESTDLSILLRAMPQCRTLAVTGQKALDTLCRRYPEAVAPKVGQSSDFTLDERPIRLFRMPSTSRAYPMALAQKAESYKILFQETSLL